MWSFGMRRVGLNFGVFCVLCCAGVVANAAEPATQLNSAARLKAFAKLPDWRGAWEATGSIKLIETSPPGVTSYQNDPRTRDNPPYKSEWEARYQAALPRALKQGSKNPDLLLDSYTRLCAAGVPRLMASPFPFEFAITPEQTWIVFYASEVRHIYTGAYPEATAEDVPPSIWGYSKGHWDRGVLRIETTGMPTGVWLDTTPMILSDQAKIRERIHQVGKDLLQNDIEIEDPEAFTAVWKITRQYRRIANFTPAGEDTCRGVEDKTTGSL